jgi:hypothetical protein
MQGSIATFAETIVADAGLARSYDMRLLNTARTGTREGGRLNRQCPAGGGRCLADPSGCSQC